MGIFTKSLIVLIVALSTPIIYRQFASDKTIKFMSAYYSNFKSVDQFLRQSAGQLDRAKDYLPEREQLEDSFKNIRSQVNSIVKSVSEKINEASVSTNKAFQAELNLALQFVQCPGEKEKVRLWSKHELSQYDGKSKKQEILLGFLGLVYNVTANMQHYSAGSDYNAFAGRDATRAFITGNFTHDLTDDISGLDDSAFAHLDSWASFYSTSYSSVGRLEGNFYDSRGCPTSELKRVQTAMKKLASSMETKRDYEKEYPECNSEWNSDLKKGRVWCTKKSGGIERDWVGVPRIFDQGESRRCGCFNQEALVNKQLKGAISLYPDCKPEATECSVTQ